MKNKSIKTLLTVILLSLLPFFSYGDWNDWINVDSWKNWGAKKLGLSSPTNEQDDSPEEKQYEAQNPEDKEIAQADNETKKVDFYDTLGIKFFADKYLIGTDATLKKHLNTLFQNKQKKAAISYFISLERKNHDLAISILEDLAPNNRLTLLLDSPPAFIAKLFVDMRSKDFKGKTLSHWGTFTLESAYFGTKKVDHAEIKGESVTLQYITFILFHNNNKTKEEFALRAFALANILSHVASANLPSLLVYTDEEAAVKLGQKHKSCFGAVKSKGSCDEETIIQLPTDFIAGLLNFMHKQAIISNKDLVNVLEIQFSINQERFQAILKKIDPVVLQEIILNFSEDVHAFLPDDIILQALPVFDEEDVLKITDQKGEDKGQQIILPTSKNNDKLEKDSKEDL